MQPCPACPPRACGTAVRWDDITRGSWPLLQKGNPFATLPTMDFDLRERTILLTVAGSRAYGIHRPESDMDVKGVGIATAPYYHGFLRRWDQAEGSHMGVFSDLLTEEEARAAKATKLDGVVYDIRKFVSLAADDNPNILDVLFCRDEEVRLCTPLGQKLREHREAFLSAKCKYTFSGYAAAQLKRIKGHRAWLMNPPSHAPTRAEFDLPETTLIPADQLAAANAAVQKQLDSWEFDFSGMADSEIVRVEGRIRDFLVDMCTRSGLTPDETKWLAAARTVGIGDNLVYVMQREREYEAAARHFKQYQEWKKNRNTARAELEAKHGFDSKHGAHLVRLLRMGREILTTGKVHVWRGPGGSDDADEIRSVRDGAWTYDQLVEWAEKEDAELEAIYRERRYVVPKAPNREAIDRLCIELVETALEQG